MESDGAARAAGMRDAMAATLSGMADAVRAAVPRPVHGTIVSLSEGIVRARLPAPRIGDACILGEAREGPERLAEIVGVEDGIALLAPLSDIEGLQVSGRVRSTGAPLRIDIGPGMSGRVLDATGRPRDGRPLKGPTTRVSLRSPPLDAMERQLASDPFETGVRAVDALLTMAKGQRMGVVGPAGCGKSTLLATILTHARFDRAVIAMIGERGREVREFVERLLPPEERARCIFVVSTSDENPGTRSLAAQSAVRIAESFADRGEEVLLVFDSLTRYARARRDMGLAIGEMPSRRGFTPRSLAAMAGLIERAGTRRTGAITAFFSVLTEGDEDDDPVREEALSLLDGHIELSPKLARAGHYPAIDILRSKSRLIDVAAGPDGVATADAARALLDRREEIDLMIQVGDHVPGRDPSIDLLLETCAALNTFLRQNRDDRTAMEEAQHRLAGIVA